MQVGAVQRRAKELGVVLDRARIGCLERRIDGANRSDVDEEITLFLVVSLEPPFAFHDGREIQSPFSFQRKETRLSSVADAIALGLDIHFYDRSHLPGKRYGDRVVLASIDDAGLVQRRREIVALAKDVADRLDVVGKCGTSERLAVLQLNFVEKLRTVEALDRYIE